MNYCLDHFIGLLTTYFEYDLSLQILFVACLCLFLALTEAAPFNAVGPHYNGDIARVPHFSIQVSFFLSDI